MREIASNTVLKIKPKSDGRWRVNRSERLWIITRRWSKEKTHIESLGALESIQRSVYRIEGKNGEWVRYDNRYHPLHSAKELSDLLIYAKNNNVYFFNNEIRNFDLDAFSQTEPAPYIFCDEAGSLA